MLFSCLGRVGNIFVMRQRNRNGSITRSTLLAKGSRQTVDYEGARSHTQCTHHQQRGLTGLGDDAGAGSFLMILCRGATKKKTWRFISIATVTYVKRASQAALLRLHEKVALIIIILILIGLAMHMIWIHPVLAAPFTWMILSSNLSSN